MSRRHDGKQDRREAPDRALALALYPVVSGFRGESLIRKSKDHLVSVNQDIFRQMLADGFDPPAASEFLLKPKTKS